MKSTIKLFKGLPIHDTKLPDWAKENPELTEKMLKETVRMGFVFAPEVLYNYSDRYVELIKMVEEVYGITGKEANASFHKSWQKVKEADIEQLFFEQIIHYITTYGFEELGIYNEESVYIPNEKLEIPELEEGITLTIIKGYTKEELKDKLMLLLSSGIALKEDTIADVIDVALYVELNSDDVDKVKNKEVKIILYEYLDIMPSNPVEFLRYAVYVATDETLLIKSKELIDKIKANKNIKIIKMFWSADLKKLAEIFYRFKPIFLALRTNREMKVIINKIRKLAIKYHKPMPEDYLNEITAKIKLGKDIEIGKLNSELDRVNIFRKIRLAYALKFRTKDVDSILYRIRNGKSYATEFDFQKKGDAQEVLDIVMVSIIKDIKKNVEGKMIYIPDYINYSLPATEKQFTGNFPSGSYVTVPNDMIFGVHWENVGKNRIDLDLSLLNVTVGKIGWDGDYRSYQKDILFSGDITDAPKPKGATELFYVQKQTKNSYLLFLNYYNYDELIKVPYKIFVASEKVENIRNNYMVNPNNILTVVQSEVSKRQYMLGLLVSSETESRFYFTETAIGKTITSYGAPYVENTRKFLANYYYDSIDLKTVLMIAGAAITDSKEGCDIDLSPENIDRESILKLLL